MTVIQLSARTPSQGPARVFLRVSSGTLFLALESLDSQRAMGIGVGYKPGVLFAMLRGPACRSMRRSGTTSRSRWTRPMTRRGQGALLPDPVPPDPFSPPGRVYGDSSPPMAIGHARGVESNKHGGRSVRGALTGRTRLPRSACVFRRLSSRLRASGGRSCECASASDRGWSDRGVSPTPGTVRTPSFRGGSASRSRPGRSASTRRSTARRGPTSARSAA